MKRSNLFPVAAFASLAVLFLGTGCDLIEGGKDALKSSSTAVETQVSLPSGPAPSVEFQPGALLGISDVTPQEFNLGVSRTLSVRVQAAHNFTGTVAFTFERDELDVIDTLGDVVTTVTPASKHLNPDEVVDLQVTINVKASSHSFAGSHFHVVATEMGSVVPAVATTEVPLTVKNIYEIQMKGGAAPENDIGGTNVNFRKHTGGVIVRFLNLDTANIAHLVHSSGAIGHQGTTDNTVRSYVVTVPTGTSKTTASWYCHSHESSAFAHTMTFNN